MKTKDLTGNTYGKWAVKGYSHSKTYKTAIHHHYIVECSCGTIQSIQSGYLTNGTSTACRKCTLKTHGKSTSPEYTAWSNMKSRCYDENAINYQYYGGRGIKVEEAWLDKKNGFIEFLTYIGPRPSSHHSIDRENNDKGYFPGNIRWAHTSVQANNRRSTRRLTHNEVTLTLTEWAKKLGISDSTLFHRLETLPHDECFSCGPQSKTKRKYGISVKDIASKIGCSTTTAHNYLAGNHKSKQYGEAIDLLIATI